MIEGKVEMKGEGWHEVEGHISRQAGKYNGSKRKRTYGCGMEERKNEKLRKTREKNG